mmetsp:Transcript_9186/g.18400  ORF Transcript_9186/g.18400 Transcript_9186/m.18400 type:complete len:294 (+) Transcript_9186:126-1007(+)
MAVVGPKLSSFVACILLLILPSASAWPTSRLPRASFRSPATEALSRPSMRLSKVSQSPFALAAGDSGGGDGINSGSEPSGQGDGDDERPEGGDGVGGPLSGFQRWLSSSEAQDDIKTYTLSLFIALSIRFLLIEPRYIPSLSMYPTFEVGDQLAVEKVTKRVRPQRRGEVVVFNPPAAFREIVSGESADTGDSKKAKEALIKRVVALAGDTVVVKSGILYVNGMPQDEPYTAEKALYDFGPVTVPEGKLLVLGDNRNHSLDGHIWGFLPQENVIGRAVYLYWPPWRLGNENLF